MPIMSARLLSLPCHFFKDPWLLPDIVNICGSCSALDIMLFHSRCRRSCTSITACVWRFGPKCPALLLTCTTQCPQQLKDPYSQQVSHQPWSSWKMCSQPSSKALAKSYLQLLLSTLKHLNKTKVKNIVSCSYTILLSGVNTELIS